MSKSLRLLTKNERCERIAQVAYQKWANKWIAHFFELIAHSLIFGQKTSNSLGKPMSKFPALRKCLYVTAIFISLIHKNCEIDVKAYTVHRIEVKHSALYHNVIIYSMNALHIISTCEKRPFTTKLLQWQFFMNSCFSVNNPKLVTRSVRSRIGLVKAFGPSFVCKSLSVHRIPWCYVLWYQYASSFYFIDSSFLLV